MPSILHTVFSLIIAQECLNQYLGGSGCGGIVMRDFKVSNFSEQFVRNKDNYRVKTKINVMQVSAACHITQ